jgi:hypothetical protein
VKELAGNNEGNDLFETVVEDSFRFEHGRTMFVGAVSFGPPFILAGPAELPVDGVVLRGVPGQLATAQRAPEVACPRRL